MNRVSIVAASLVCVAGIATAGAKIEIDEQSGIDLGFRVQPLLVVTESDIDGDGELDTESDFKVRRARLRLKGTLTDRITAFLQTDIGSGANGSGYDWRVIDAWVSVRINPLFTVLAGENMVPASRQNLTSSGALMAIDRPGINYKTLTWGTRSVYAFANRTFLDADAGLRGEIDVRDAGATAFGATSFTDDMHFKYYAGVYDGIQFADEDNLRYAGRVQVNFFDAEDKYFNLSTYLGSKKTVGIGASYDTQDAVSTCESMDVVDYTFYTFDAFVDLPCGPGTFTAEAAYEMLDL
ncbi:MAG: porin, partial [Verrucomicrobia bacterium]|nr:porin [Verrucomicrobiota bacterium]